MKKHRKIHKEDLAVLEPAKDTDEEIVETEEPKKKPGKKLLVGVGVGIGLLATGIAALIGHRKSDDFEDNDFEDPDADDYADAETQTFDEVGDSTQE